MLCSPMLPAREDFRVLSEIRPIRPCIPREQMFLKSNRVDVGIPIERMII